jgi:GxxExxY protein
MVLIQYIDMMQLVNRNDTKRSSVNEQNLTSQLMHIAISIHRMLGPGLVEGIYEKCFCYELAKRKIPFKRMQQFPVVYGDLLIDDGIRVDLVVDDLIVIELKAEENYHPLWDAQLLSFLKLTGKRLGYIMNFRVPLMKEGITRMSL